MTAIDNKYNALGASGGFLGRPIDEGAGAEEMPTADGRGTVRDFEGGSIYWSPQTGAFEVHGGIRLKWAQVGGVRSFLGYPTTDETITPDGRGRFNHFQGGSIYWTPETGAIEVHGLIREKWASMGWERSRMGYPIKDEKNTPDGRGRVSEFEGGHILWTPESGTEVRQRID